MSIFAKIFCAISQQRLDRFLVPKILESTQQHIWHLWGTLIGEALQVGSRFRGAKVKSWGGSLLSVTLIMSWCRRPLGSQLVGTS